MVREFAGMGARKSLLATGCLLFGFCLVTGCALQRGTAARSQPSAITIDPAKPSEVSLKEGGRSIEKPSADISTQETPVRENSVLANQEQHPASYPAFKKAEPLTPQVARTLSTRAKEHRQSGTAQDDSPIALQKTPGPRADDRLLDLLDNDLDNAIRLPVQRRRLEFSKAVIDHPRVRHFIEIFANEQKEYFAKRLARSGRYFPMIAQVLQDAGLPQELAYLALIESNFQPHAVSPSGAVGLWQFVPQTARRFGLRIDSWVDERRDPVKSTRAAAAYLKELHARFGRWYLATAAYNAGQGAIHRAMKDSGAKDFWSLSAKAKLSDETRNFVPKFVAAALIATRPQKYGFDRIEYDAPLSYDEVEVAGNSQLALLAAMSGTDTEALQDLNPELLRSHTPPGEDRFRLKLPAGSGALVEQLQQGETAALKLVVHEVQRGDTLFALARRYRQNVKRLMEFNGLASSTLRIGQKLTILLESLRGGPR
jgi:hypothetical protein